MDLATPHERQAFHQPPLHNDSLAGRLSLSEEAWRLIGLLGFNF